LWGYRGQVLVREGTGFSNTLVAYDEFSAGRLFDAKNLPPFGFELEDFEAEFEREGTQKGSPRQFTASALTRFEPGANWQRETLEVNHPLEFSGTKIFLTGHGYAPVLTVTDPAGQVQFSDSVVFLPRDGNFTSIGVVKIPDAPQQVGLEGIFLPSAVVDEERGPISVFPAPDSPALFLVAWQGDLGVDSGEPQNIYQLRTEDMKRLGVTSLLPGDVWSLPQLGQVRFEGVDRFISLQIAHEPGRQLVLVASIAALIGLLFGLFVPRRRIWLKVTNDTQKKTVVEVAGLSRQGYAGLSSEIAEMLGEVRRVK
jgi:cytochrome c biogenesis protein